ncbi:protein kinase (plasmid) [Cytobacillus spongiae]|uniref:serine/threonine protein kinase n=1 Tax=Cytobacillus spongiae TaxID=2901381 RepID=UPI001CD52C59|nr:protein kinase [Cytobacillus spongiae]MCA1063059.1 protein kinase [Rossellomorea aquimaris]UII58649.1 protein kinase [Cytobacillus spongiae]WJV28322.1 protein kinase [Rossellomorea sp. AcN35-11]
MVHALLRRLIDGFEQTWKPGEIIEGYHIVRLVGRGSYGTTYSVSDPSNSKEAILKRIRPYKKLFSNHVQYVQNEMNALATLSHHQFPTVYTSGKYRNTPYFIMERMKGQTFEELIFKEGKTYSEEESVKLGIQLVTLVEWIHENGYVHRDLRIPNILMHEGTLHVIDFGLAGVIRHSTKRKSNMHRDYMRELSPQSDFYALGHFLLFLLYSSYEPVAKKEKSWEEELDIHPDTRAMIRRLLQIDTAFSDAGEILVELSKVLQSIQES